MGIGRELHGTGGLSVEVGCRASQISRMFALCLSNRRHITRQHPKNASMRKGMIPKIWGKMIERQQNGRGYILEAINYDITEFTAPSRTTQVAV